MFVHPEAALMGLLNHYNHYSEQADQGEDTQRTQQIVQLVRSFHSEEVEEAGEATIIALTQKCCWCCHWLGEKLESQFVVPATHGVMYPWDPPKVGVSELVLKKLEDELWNQLCEVMLRELLYVRIIEPPEIYIPFTLELPPHFRLGPMFDE